jgi:hypothetical protein
MKTTVRYSRGRLRYTGQIGRESFVAWARSSHGRAVIDRTASQIPFTLFGRARAARRRIWRQLVKAARLEAVVAAVQREIDGFLARLQTLALAHDLPRVGVDLHRLVVVPRAFVNAKAYGRIDSALRAQPMFVGLEGGESLRDRFVLTLIESIETAVVRAQPSPKRPLPAGDGWITVGVNDHFQWRVAFDGPPWPGHYYVFELPRRPLTRGIRRAVGDGIAGLEASLPSLSRVHRNEIVRQASRSLEQLLTGARLLENA